MEGAPSVCRGDRCRRRSVSRDALRRILADPGNDQPDTMSIAGVWELKHTIATLNVVGDVLELSVSWSGSSRRTPEPRRQFRTSFWIGRGYVR